MEICRVSNKMMMMMMMLMVLVLVLVMVVVATAPTISTIRSLSQPILQLDSQADTNLTVSPTITPF